MKPKQTTPGGASSQAGHASSRQFQVTGVIVEQETGRPLPELVVRAFDRDFAFDDLLGYANTDADGRFAIRFDSARFRDFTEIRPDLYLQVYDALGSRMLHETSDAIRWDAGLREDYRIQIPAQLLNPRAKPFSPRRRPRGGSAPE
jgi:hypothetical protein